MTASDLVLALQPVAETLAALGVRFFVGGSIASSAHGVARASLDADIVAELQLELSTHLSIASPRLTTFQPNGSGRPSPSRSSCNADDRRLL